MNRSLTQLKGAVALSCALITICSLSGCGANSSAPSADAEAGTFPAASVSSYDFGTRLAGSTVTQTVVTLSNPTSVTFALGSEISGDASFTVATASQTCGSSLAPDSSCTLAVTFAPKAASVGGVLSANLQIDFHNLRTTFKQAVALTGTPLALAAGSVSSTANPQVALYTVNMPAAGTASVQFGPTTAYGLHTWTKTATAAGPISFYVAGMLPNSTYHMQALVQLPNGSSTTDADQIFATGQPEVQAVISAATTSGLTPQPGVEQLSTGKGGPFSLVVTDLSGQTIWSYAIPNNTIGLSIEGARMMQNGDFLMTLGQGSGTPLSLPSASTQVAVREIDLAGNTVRNITAADLTAKLKAASYNITLQQFHHDLIPMANGHWIVLANELRTFQNLTGRPGATTVLGDVVIDLDPTGEPVWVWDSFDHLDINRHPLSFPDWTHANALVYTPDDGNLIISMRHQNWVMKLDYANGRGSGTILWRLGEGGDYKLVNGTDPTDWNYAQHFPSLASKSNSGVFSLVMMNNGDDREFPPGVVCNTPGNPPCFYTSVPIFRLDESAKTATLTYNDVLPTSEYSFFGGNAELLDNGNIEYDLAGLNTGAAAAYEVTPTASPQVVWQMHMGGYTYRAFRIPSLYPGVQW